VGPGGGSPRCAGRDHPVPLRLLQPDPPRPGGLRRRPGLPRGGAPNPWISTSSGTRSRATPRELHADHRRGLVDGAPSDAAFRALAGRSHDWPAAQGRRHPFVLVSRSAIRRAGRVGRCSYAIRAGMPSSSRAIGIRARVHSLTTDDGRRHDDRLFRLSVLPSR
jgi:hypothetical protein